jgi:mono/diheme cytochrome c family protein
MVMLSASINTTAARMGRFLPHVMALLCVALLATVLTRHFYRDEAVRQGGLLSQANLSLDPDDDPSLLAMPGRTLYIANCKICHGNQALAPSLGEIQSLYKANPQGIVKWAAQPGRKRAQYGPMPPMGHLHAQRLNLIAQFMLASGKLRNEHKQPAAGQ